jgi:hypothetical protein
MLVPTVSKNYFPHWYAPRATPRITLDDPKLGVFTKLSFPNGFEELLSSTFLHFSVANPP